GHQVSMIELLEDSVKHARFLAENHKEDFLFAPRILCADFYEIELDETFDIVCYFDSFGIGTDAEQRQLLHRIYNWLKPDSEAFALIEVGNPIYWASSAKDQKMDFGEYIRVYDFDATTCRLLDYWYPKKNPQQAVHQKLRCYTLPDLQLLLEGTNLKIDAVLPSGKMDYERMKWIEQAELIDCMTYYVRLRKQA
ncbi:MAG: class I SAM-dependent methyltransferase, partial [Saprospiraceae bacterium]|nr:class I SAM-dependent methyltransferase [Saprospiraceae bacterium]